MVIIAALLLFVRLGSAPIYILDEAKNAQCAREMWDRGDWVVPTFNGGLRTDKPALHYWFMRAAYQVGGVGAAQARFFSAFFGLLLVCITYHKVKAWVGNGIAFFSAAALVLSPHFLFEFRLSVPDPYLIFFTTLGLYFGYGYLEGKKRLSLLLTSVSLGLAMLAKGPVALALPGLVFMAYVVVKKYWWVFKDPYIFASVFIALVIAAPWYYAVHEATGGAFTRGFFLDHNLNRFSAEKEGHGGPFIITPLIVVLGMLPASLLAICGMGKRQGFWGNPLFLFAFIVVAVYVCFFSISSTKLPNYPMPCYPFVAILAGFTAHNVFTGKAKVPGWVWATWLVLALAIPVGGFIALHNDKAVGNYAWVALCLFCLPLCLGLAWRIRKRVLPSFRAIGLGWVAFSLTLLWVGYPLVYKQNPVTKLLPALGDRNLLLAYKAYNPAFNFNLEKDYIIPVYQQVDSLRNFVNARANAKGGGDICIVSRLQYLPELEGAGFKEIARYRDLFELPTTVILKLNQ